MFLWCFAYKSLILNFDAIELIGPLLLPDLESHLVSFPQLLVYEKQLSELILTHRSLIHVAFFLIEGMTCFIFF